jgi:antitoxin component YwqK of YwqJK toxin-antitoxin module
MEYDEQGELVNYNNYSDSGTLIYTFTKKDNLSLVTEFFDNGKLKSETVTETTMEDDAEVETSHIKDYYQNGGLRQESSTIDGELDGLKKVWDEKGNLVLQVKYRRGLIQD